MKTINIICLFLVATTGAIRPTLAQTNTAPASHPNRFSLSSRFGFNIAATFKSTTLPTNPGLATGGAADRYYQDGFVRVDSSGNANDTTWFWGYENASQIDLANDRVLMNAATPSATGAFDNKGDDSQEGFELSYRRELGRHRGMSFAVEAAFGFTDLEIAGTTRHATDAFALGGIIAPTAPYAGTFVGPGPMIGSVPTRGATTTQHKIDASLYGWRLGPSLEFPICQRLSASVGGGLALVLVDSDYKTAEVSEVGGLRAIGPKLVNSRDDFLVGGYVGGGFSWECNDKLSVFAGAQYQNVGHFTQRISHKQAMVDLGDSVFLLIGLGFSF